MSILRKTLTPGVVVCLHGSSDKVITCSEGKLKSTNGGGLGISSFVPRPPPLKQGRSGSSGRKVDVGGRGQY